MQNAVYLSKICPKVYIFQNLDHLTGEQKLIDAINETENIEVRLSTTVSRLTGEFKLEIVEVKHEGITENVLCEGLFVSIGKRYRREDEIGTPYCVTIDFDSLENDTYTIRDRDTMEQKRMTIDEIVAYVNSKIAF